MVLKCCTLCAAVFAAIAAAGSIWFLVINITEYRADDFYKGTDTTDFTALGTCVGVITTDQMESAMEGFNSRKFNDGNFHCDDTGREDWIGRAVAVSVHGLYYVWSTTAVAGGATATSAGTLSGDFVNKDGTFTFGSVVRTAISATVLGGCQSCAAETTYDYGGAGKTAWNPAKKATSVQYPTVKRQDAYQALKVVADADVPVSCDTIYGMTGADAEGGAFEESDPDTAEKAYAREYFRKLVDEHGGDDWPVSPIVGSCNDNDIRSPTMVSGAGVGTETWYGSQLADSMAIDSQTKLLLYAHCVAQHRYVASGLHIPYHGSFGLPAVGQKPGPASDALHVYTVDGHDVNNIGANYTLRARLYQGQRFGYSTWAYVPMILASTFLCADALVFFLAEAALPFAISGARAYTTDNLVFRRNSLILAATKKSSRVKRLIFGFVLVLVSVIFWALYALVPFNALYENRMPRPYCEKDDTGIGDESQKWTWAVMDLGYRGTKGGWKSDWDASAYEFCTIILQIVILFLLPLTTTGCFDVCNKVRSRRSAGNSELTPTGTQTDAGTVPNSSRYRFHMAVFIPLLAVAAFFMILGQSISGARFGMAWAQGVVGHEHLADGSNKYNERLLAEEVYNQTVATICLCIALGLVIGTAMQRYLIAYVGCFGAFFFFGWVAILILCFVPFLVIATIRSIIPEDADDDCETHFGGGKDDTALGICVFRNWSFIVAGIVILIILAIITVFGAREALGELFRARRRETVDEEVSVSGEPHRLMREQFPVSGGRGTLASARSAPGIGKGVYRSKDESFYNYSTKTDSNVDIGNLLYAPRVTFDVSMTGSTGARGPQDEARLLAAATATRR